MTLCAWLVSFFSEDLIAQIDALVADVHARTGNELSGLLLVLSAKRAGEINFASFAAALLSGADVTVESSLDGGDAHAEVAEHAPGTRTRIKRQRGEQVLGAHVAAPGLLGNRGRPPQRLTGLGRLLWRPPAGQTSCSWEQFARGGAYRADPHSQLLQDGGGYPLMEKPDQLMMGAHLGGPVSGGFPPGRLQAAAARCAQPPGLRCAPPRVRKALPGRLLGYPYPLADLGPGTPALRASSTNWPISSSAPEASSSLTVRAASTRSSGAPGACWRTASTSSATLTAATSTT